MSTLSTHVLDTALGKPATGIPVTLASGAKPLGRALTDADGRVREFAGVGSLEAGTYTLTFAVAEYFKAGGRSSLYSNIAVEFHIPDATGHYHIPLLLSPFGYSTYRGS
jgi:5-hydroxyisourate hydrolase